MRLTTLALLALAGLLASITLVNANHIVTEWTAWRDGKPAEVMVFDLTRKS